MGEEEYYYKRMRNHVPEFGSWDWNDNLPFTQCFESARRQGGGLVRHRQSYSESEDHDLYVTGEDLYQKKDVVTSTMFVIPRTKAMYGGEHDERETKKKNWVSDVNYEPTPMPRPKQPKPVDEDLYTISPKLLYVKVKKKRVLCFFSSCLLPTCSA